MSEPVQRPQFWRSLDGACLDNEFVSEVEAIEDPVTRRRLIEMMGASLGLAGLTGCTRQPDEKIVPYVRAPEEFIPGKPLFFATALAVSGFADPVLVESHMGRPTKIEGNPEHPASLGATDIFRQAAILDLYDPDRSQVVTRQGRVSSWVSFLAAAATLRESLLATRGEGFRILTEAVTSPSLRAALNALLAELPGAKWCQFEPVSRENIYEGTRLAFGQRLHPVQRVEKARVILALDDDLLNSGPGAVRHARDFAAGRNPDAPLDQTMKRLYAVESCPTITGASADHRLALASGEIEAYARALAVELGVIAGAAGTRAPEHWVKAVAKDLAANKGASLVTAGAHQPANVHALAAAINAHLNNVGATVNYTEPLEQAGTQALHDLIAEMKAGKVSRLVMLGGNPLYTAPGDLDFASALRKVALRIHLGAYDDETSAVCHWHIAEAHALESWGDARAHDGTTSIQQPLIAPLYDGHTALEVVAALAGRSGASAHELLKEYWQAKAGSWDKILHDGWIEGSTAESKPVSVKLALGTAVNREGIEVNFRPDPCLWDGRFANNGWLQELPRPITKLTWSNAVLMAPALASKLGVSNEEIVSVKTGADAIEAPAWIVPGHAADSITIHLGYGRWRAGRIANGVGVNANIARRWAEPWIESGARIEKTGRRERMAVTQEHGSMEGRGLIRIAGVEEYQKDPAFAQRQNHGPKNVKELSMYQPYEYKGYSWGMTIDLNACTGCNACTIACQSENNIPIVGREEVIRGREMHWIRMDRYFEGDIDDPSIHHQPLACVHCDNAPCEVVCPVAATTHSSEGLNQMTYNRCVGTRYCANNCPYKARRFNFFLYGDWESKSLDAMRNPDVTVRSRGVMEKCTYCVQRINAARIDAEREDRKIRDGEVVTACQQACPSRAIVFGDMNDPASRISKMKKSQRDYGLLTELNTQPRTSYLARVRNGNPEMEKA